MNEFEWSLENLARFIGYLAAIYGFARLLLADWSKKRKEQMQAKIDAEAESHAPLVEQIEALGSSLGTKIDRIHSELDDIRKEQQEDRDLNKQVARLSLAMADETGERAGTNGKTREAAQKLRETLLVRA